MNLKYIFLSILGSAVCCFWGFQSLHADLPSFSDVTASGLEINLKEPSYEDGVLFTDQGGVITGPNMRLQAMKIRYIKKEKKGKAIHRIQAEGQLIFVRGGRAYVGKSLEYDLNAQKGYIIDGCTSIEPWFIGGSRIEVRKDGSCVIKNGWVTTSENQHSDWTISSQQVSLSKGTLVQARNVCFSFVKVPLLWLPSFSANIKGLSRTPFKYKARWGGKQGTRIGITYDFQSSSLWKNQILLDLSIKRGLGGGILTRYLSSDKKESLNTTSYVARDISVAEPHKRNRYRFQGSYNNVYNKDRYHLNIGYDKVSDPYMPGDYTDMGFEALAIGITEAKLWRRDKDWLASAITKVRLNHFQTVRQQLPGFHFNARPIELGSSGWILNNQLDAAYLDLRYANKFDQPSIHSTRLEINQTLYRPTSLNILTLTPHIGYTLIGYGNSPEHDSRILAMARLGIEMHARLVRVLPATLHAIEPYIRHTTVTHPNQSPTKHYLFDLEDGLYREHVTRFGFRNYWLNRHKTSFTQRLSADIYANWFHDIFHIKSKIPTANLDLLFKAHPRIDYFSQIAWNIGHHQINQFNLGSRFTVNDNLALSLEYRYRGPYQWRKVDPENYMLDYFRSENDLRHSRVSDKRSTVLTRIFCRISSSLALEFRSRHGFNRTCQKRYNEYEANLMTVIKNALRVKFSYKHKVLDDRFDISFSLGGRGPTGPASNRRINEGNWE